MKTNAIYILIIALFSAGCKTQSIPGVIKLDNKYRFYTREVSRVEKPNQEKKTQTNIQAVTPQERKDLLEVQFLMLNDSLRSAIYIAMKPDLNRKHYSKYESNVLNIGDIQTIRFGKTFSRNGVITRVKFFSKDMYSSSLWEISGSRDQLYLNRIQYWWGDYNDAYFAQGFKRPTTDVEFLESEINVDEALTDSVSFVRTFIDRIKHKDVVYPMPAGGGLTFKATKKHRRMKATFRSGDQIEKTFRNKQIRSSPLPLMVKDV
jgi:hypothetical protein